MALAVLFTAGLPAGTLIAPGVFRSPLSLIRGQVAGVSATALGADGATWGTFAADVPRFNGTARRLLIEGQRTNAVANPRGEGGTVGGTGIAVPTGWDNFSNNGLTTTFVARGTENGRQYVDLRFSGTTTGTFYVHVFSNPAASISAGQVAAGSVWVSLVGGALTNISSVAAQLRWSGAGGTVDQTFTPSAVPARIAVAGTAPVGATGVWFGWILTFANGVAIDCTLRFSWPQLEVGAAFASSAILPPVGTPGASTRGADLVSASLSSLGIPASGACTVLWSGRFTGITGQQTVVQIDAGSNANRYMVDTTAGSVLRVLGVGGVASGTIQSLGVTAVADTPYRIGMAIDGAGRVAASLNGAAALASTGTTLNADLTTFRLGRSVAGTSEPWFGVNALRVLPYTLSDTDLAAAVAALPT